MLELRSFLTLGFVVGPKMSWRSNLPSGRWDEPAGVQGRVPRRKSVGTMTVPPRPILNAKTNAVSTQTSANDWCVSYRRSTQLADDPQVVIESMTFSNSTIRVEEEEVVLTPQPVTAEIYTNDPEEGTEVARDQVDMTQAPTPQDQGERAAVLEQVGAEANTGPVERVADPGPVGIEILLPDPDLRCPLCEVRPGGITMLGKHLACQHAGITVLYKCRKCGRTNSNSHSISCHVPKCKGGGGERVDNGGFTCELCGGRFQTAVGLTQHKRHTHPAELNRERLEGRGALNKECKRVRLWSVEEVEAVSRLERKYLGNPRINLLIAEEMGTGKTAEQVRSKRRVLLAALARQGPDEGDEGGDALSTPEVPIIPRPPPDLAHQRLREALERGGGSEGENEIRALAQSVRDVDQNPGLIESSALDLIRRLGKVGAPGRDRVGQERSRAMKGWERRLSQKKHDYRVHQRLYTRDQAKLAALVLDGADSVECNLPIETVHEAFRERWEMVGEFHGLGQFRSTRETDNSEFHTPVLASEVSENLTKMKNGSAPGPDGICKKALLDWDPRGEQLARLFTTWLVHGVIPKPFKECRTKLLPKSGNADELQDINGWRPVTIGSLVLRLFTRMLAMRLQRACPLNPRQRGFLADSSGCAENLVILDEIIRRSRSGGAPLAVMFIDFAKAFDSISHEHIRCALEQRRVDRHVIELIRNSYVDCVTRVGSGGQKTPPIDMKVGVKQGDPMSPLLFNLAMDPLIQALDETGSGWSWDDRRITTLAFADDLVLVSGSVRGMGRNLEILETFCQTTGLRVQPRKCHGFYLDKGVVNGCQPWEIGGRPIHMVDPGETVRYLGVEVGPGHGIKTPDLIPTIQEWIGKIKKAPLKPSQRVRVLNSFALPRMMYRADLGGVPATTLATIDGMVRKAVKAWLHLNPSTCNGLIYSRCRDGGLGVMRFERTIPTIQIRRAIRMSRSEDDWTRHTTASAVTRDVWGRMWRQVGVGPEETPVYNLEDGPNASGRLPVIPDWRQAENRAWQTLQVQGVGADQFQGDKLSNSWLAEPMKVGFRQRHYMAGLALRAGVYPTRELSYRGRNKEGAACRRCGARLETCSHILGQCPSVKGSRVRRHHKICDLLASEAERAGWKAAREFRVEVPGGGLRIPDLVCTKDSKILVLDVTIRYEVESDTLQRAAEEKVAHYNPVAEHISTLLGGGRVRVMGFPVGARGKWPSCNNTVLAELGVTVGRRAQFARLVSRRALLYSLDVLRDFLREPVW